MVEFPRSRFAILPHHVGQFDENHSRLFQTCSRPSPAFAMLLDHVHSDHLAGLESFKSPLYDSCALFFHVLITWTVSSAPRQERASSTAERYPHRLNLSSVFLNPANRRTSISKSSLKPVPLENANRIELQPGKDIQVTLFDANHCTGAVMFCPYILPRFLWSNY